MKLQTKITNAIVFSEYDDCNDTEFILNYDVELQHDDSGIVLIVKDFKAEGIFSATIPTISSIGDEFHETSTEYKELDLSEFTVEVELHDESNKQMIQSGLSFEDCEVFLEEKLIVVR